MPVPTTIECSKALPNHIADPQCGRSATLVLQRTALLCLMPLLLWASLVHAWPGHSGASAFEEGGDAPASAQHGPQGVASAEQGDAQTFYVSQVDQGVQQQCLLCHRAGGAAPQSGARLVLGKSPVANHQAFLDLLSHNDVDGDWILAKAKGQQSHGGGAVLTQSSSLHDALQNYLLLLGESGAAPEEANTFWQGTEAEPRAITLRRSALLFGGVIPDAEALELAAQSEAGLRQAIVDTLVGAGFKNFIMRAANDHLLVDGLLNGINFDISTFDRYPELTEFLLTLPEDKPPEFEEYHDKPFLSRWDADWSFRWAITREL